MWEGGHSSLTVSVTCRGEKIALDGVRGVGVDCIGTGSQDSLTLALEAVGEFSGTRYVGVRGFHARE